MTYKRALLQIADEPVKTQLAAIATAAALTKATAAPLTLPESDRAAEQLRVSNSPTATLTTTNSIATSASRADATITAVAPTLNAPHLERDHKAMLARELFTVHAPAMTEAFSQLFETTKKGGATPDQELNRYAAVHLGVSDAARRGVVRETALDLNIPESQLPLRAYAQSEMLTINDKEFAQAWAKGVLNGTFLPFLSTIVTLTPTLSAEATKVVRELVSNTKLDPTSRLTLSALLPRFDQSAYAASSEILRTSTTNFLPSFFASVVQLVHSTNTAATGQAEKVLRDTMHGKGAVRDYIALERAADLKARVAVANSASISNNVPLSAIDTIAVHVDAVAGVINAWVGTLGLNRTPYESLESAQEEAAIRYDAARVMESLRKDRDAERIALQLRAKHQPEHLPLTDSQPVGMYLGINPTLFPTYRPTNTIPLFEHDYPVASRMGLTWTPAAGDYQEFNSLFEALRRYYPWKQE